MVALILYMASLGSQVPLRRCQEFGPRLDGTRVTVCDGSVVRVRDGIGNIREWENGGNTVILRSPGRRPMVVEKDGR